MMSRMTVVAAGKTAAAISTDAITAPSSWSRLRQMSQEEREDGDDHPEHGARDKVSGMARTATPTEPDAISRVASGLIAAEEVEADGQHRGEDHAELDRVQRRPVDPCEV